MRTLSRYFTTYVMRDHVQGIPRIYTAIMHTAGCRRKCQTQGQNTHDGLFHIQCDVFLSFACQQLIPVISEHQGFIVFSILLLRGFLITVTFGDCVFINQRDRKGCEGVL